jgi:hypothetical protein
MDFTSPFFEYITSQPLSFACTAMVRVSEAFLQVTLGTLPGVDRVVGAVWAFVVLVAVVDEESATFDLELQAIPRVRIVAVSNSFFILSPNVVSQKMHSTK